MAQEIIVRLQVPKEGGQPVLVQSEPEGDPEASGLPRSPLFKGLSATALKEIAGRARKRAFGPGSTLFEEGEVADSVYVVASGEVRRFRVDRETSTRENVVTLSVVPAGGTVGEAALVNPVRTESAETVRRAECLQWAKDDLMALMIEFPLFGLAVSQLAIQRASDAENRICNFGSGRWASKRLASLLLKLAEEEGVPSKAGIEIPRPLIQGELASIIQASRETVSLTMKKFREQGAIHVKGKIITVVPEVLGKIAGA